MLDWGTQRPLVLGMVQPPPLPASPAWRSGSVDDACGHAVNEAKALLEGGIRGVIVQNLWDGPTEPPATPFTVGAMTAVVREVRRVIDGPVGVNLDVNDGPATLAVASAAGADFIRVKVLVGTMLKSGGIVTGCAAALARARRLPGMPGVAVFADVHDRSGHPLGDVPLADDVEAALWSGADALILTGRSTQASLRMVQEARSIAGDTPILVGGGTRAETIRDVLDHVDGVIVGATLKTDGIENASVDARRVRAYVRAASGDRGPAADEGSTG